MRNLAPLWATLAALLLVGAPVAAQTDDGANDEAVKQVTVVAREDDCPDGKTFCFSIEGDPPRVSQGDEVNLTLRNLEENQGDHDVYVTTNESADSEHQDTAAEDAIANTPTISPGENASTNFTVPEGEALYLWCDQTGHEAGGMWTTIDIQSDNETRENDTFRNDTDENDTARNDTARNDTAENESDENDTFRNDTDENETARNDTTRNDTDENESDENETRESDDSGQESPLEPTEGSGDGGQEGQQAPLGVPVLAVAVLVAAVGLNLARRDR